MTARLDLPVPWERRRGVRFGGALLLVMVSGAMLGLKGPRALLYLGPLVVAFVALRPQPQGPDALALEVREGTLLVFPRDGTSPDRLSLDRMSLRWEGQRLLVEDGGVLVPIAHGAPARKAEAWLRRQLA